VARPDAVGADKDAAAADRPANAGTIKVIEGSGERGAEPGGRSRLDPAPPALATSRSCASPSDFG